MVTGGGMDTAARSTFSTLAFEVAVLVFVPVELFDGGDGDRTPLPLLVERCKAPSMRPMTFSAFSGWK